MAAQLLRPSVCRSSQRGRRPGRRRQTRSTEKSGRRPTRARGFMSRAHASDDASPFATSSRETCKRFRRGRSLPCASTAAGLGNTCSRSRSFRCKAAITEPPALRSGTTGCRQAPIHAEALTVRVPVPSRQDEFLGWLRQCPDLARPDGTERFGYAALTSGVPLAAVGAPRVPPREGCERIADAQSVGTHATGVPPDLSGTSGRVALPQVAASDPRAGADTAELVVESWTVWPVAVLQKRSDLAPSRPNSCGSFGPVGRRWLERWPRS